MLKYCIIKVQIILARVKRPEEVQHHSDNFDRGTGHVIEWIAIH